MGLTRGANDNLLLFLCLKGLGLVDVLRLQNVFLYPSMAEPYWVKHKSVPFGLRLRMVKSLNYA